ncbi:MAG: Mrp/NBP35 family ATP-binding protein [Rhizobiaceae bacterium]|jgi:ATP-binding protein involved in chromosome partitioning|nr:Mrp/NBP35 family ATP-binding protein [Rhizobiaceae bacterium]
MAPTKQDIRAALAHIKTPSGRGLGEAGELSEIFVADGKVFFSIACDEADAPVFEPIRARAEAMVKAMPGVQSAAVALTAERKAGSPKPAAPSSQGHAHGHSHTHSHAAHAGQARPPSKPEVPGIAHIIAVASGKGGVGKSTTAVNLALGLVAQGLKVGILDADIYGPSMPRLLGLSGKPRTADGKRMIPMEAWGLKVMSMGFLVEEETPMIWRGPMVMSALTQMLREVEWGILDVLVVDMPPGTGDAQLTMAQQVPLSGAVIVSTPQDLALIDARRGVAMFRKVNVPILGIVENMSYFIAPDTGKRYDIFGHGGAKAEASRISVPFLGEIPLDMMIRENSDAGMPVTAAEPQSPHAMAYRAIAATVAGQLGQGTVKAAPAIIFE